MKAPMVAIVTHAALPGGAPDDLLLARALTDLGLGARFAVWDDPAVAWASFGSAVVRSAWDYHRAPARWLRWVTHAARETVLLNPAPLLRWNTDKRYLRDITACGLPCTPTAFVEAPMARSGSMPCLAEVVAERGWSGRDVVVKPAVAASAKGARRFAAGELAGAGQTHLSALLGSYAGACAPVQPFLDAVERVPGERSLVFIAGHFSHAFSKPAFSTDAAGGTAIVPHAASAAELALAGAALAAATAGPPTYARADLVPGADGGPLLMELELIEPDLALRLAPGAAARLAVACRDAMYVGIA